MCLKKLNLRDDATNYKWHERMYNFDLPTILCCYIKKKKRKTVQKTDIVHVDEHLKVKEAIVEGPHGRQAVLLEIEDDLHVDEEIKKKETYGEGLHAKSAESNPSALEEGQSSSGPNRHQQQQQQQLEHKA
ncbi:hypothetical protein EZV62_022277 [Acer yangbiense]|uniref:Uncharacterized protein n=1 Tax=Acer yangbiense TaxID=1000413 RepID=A0A5C7H7T8_9ROSI|nr:hypothetical protein EZV62_022277 [Acer yangbiense]